MQTTNWGVSMKEALLGKVKDKSLIVGIAGLGYVGLPLAVEIAKSGYKTIGVDAQQDKVDDVNKGINYIQDVNDDDLKQVVSDGALVATCDYSLLSDADFIAICVPTPLDKYQQPNLSFIKSSCHEVAKYLKRKTAVVLESTTYPGTTEEIMRPILETGSDLICEKDFYLGFSPERVDPGNSVYSTKNTPKIVGAVGKDASIVISSIYKSFLDGNVIEVSSPAAAEMTKILENTYRNINIGLVNELAILCDQMGINIWEVIEAAKTKPFGFQAFYPGPGLGGHCIPLDPYYLAWKARKYGFHTTMIESSMTINDHMASYCVERISRILNQHKKPLNGSRILLCGLAYKQDVDDCRESPAIRIYDLLADADAAIDYYDPYISKALMKNGKTVAGLKEINPEIVSQFDIIVITTPHSSVDYDMIANYARAVFDTRNAMSAVQNRENIELL